MSVYLILHHYSGRLGNKLIQHIAIRSISEKYGFKYRTLPIIIDGIKLDLKYTNIQKNEKLPIKKINLLALFHTINIKSLKNNTVYNLAGYFQKYEYMSKNVLNNVREAFQKIQLLNQINECIVHIRVGDLFKKNVHRRVSPNHPVLPINYYKKMLKNEKLPIRFIAETLNESYIDELKKSFPKAKYQSSDITKDFITLLRARKLYLSVSTFTWVALLISNNCEKAFVPLYGLFHPSQRANWDYGKFIIKDNLKNITYCDFNWNEKKNPWIGDDNDYKKAIETYDISTITEHSLYEIIKKYQWD